MIPLFNYDAYCDLNYRDQIIFHLFKKKVRLGWKYLAHLNFEVFIHLSACIHVYLHMFVYMCI